MARTGDDADHAQEQIEAFNEAAIARQRKLAQNEDKEAREEWDGVHCVRCWIELPVQRADAGRIRCVTCQEIVEKERRWKR